MVRRQPHLLSGYGTLIYEFARFCAREGLSTSAIPLRLIKYTAEMMPEHQRDFARTFFGCPVVSEYGTAETGVISFQHPDGSHHVMEDCVYVEYEKDEASGLFRILVTNLHSQSYPLIRYDTGDLVRGDGLGICTCSLPFRVMEDVIGRSSDIVKAPGGRRVHSNIFSYIMKELVKRYDSVEQLRFVQIRLDVIRVEMSLREGTSMGLQDFIRGMIRERIHPDMDVKFEITKHIPRMESGKRRYFVSELDHDPPARVGHHSGLQ